MNVRTGRREEEKSSSTSCTLASASTRQLWNVNVKSAAECCLLSYSSFADGLRNVQQEGPEIDTPRNEFAYVSLDQSPVGAVRKFRQFTGTFLTRR